MDNKEAFNAIERAQHYNGICYDAMGKVNDFFTRIGKGEEVNEQSSALRQSALYHHDVAISLYGLEKWALATPPQSKEYGKDAQKWLMREKGSYVGFASMIAGYALGIGSAFAHERTFSGIMTMIGGLSGLTAVALQARNRIMRPTNDLAKYISALHEYYGRNQHFDGATVEHCAKTLTHYADTLGNLINTCRPYKMDDTIDDIINNQITMREFAGALPQVVSAIRKNMQNPVPRWALGREITAAKGRMKIDHMSQMMVHLHKSTAELVGR